MHGFSAHGTFYVLSGITWSVRVNVVFITLRHISFSRSPAAEPITGVFANSSTMPLKPITENPSAGRSVNSIPAVLPFKRTYHSLKRGKRRILPAKQLFQICAETLRQAFFGITSTGQRRSITTRIRNTRHKRSSLPCRNRKTASAFPPFRTQTADSA